MGGLASYNPSQVRDPRAFSTRAQIAISAAGPLAGFLLAALIIVVILLSGNAVGYDFVYPFGPVFFPPGYRKSGRGLFPLRSSFCFGDLGFVQSFTSLSTRRRPNFTRNLPASEFATRHWFFVDAFTGNRRYDRSLDACTYG